MSYSLPRPAWRGRMMYKHHPHKDTLFAGNPLTLANATQNLQPIRFDDLAEMHKLVWELATEIANWQPHLVPFFATGGIPYLIPVMHVLEKKQLYSLIDGHHFHMYPGLAWGGNISGKNSEDYFVSSFSRVIRSLPDCNHLRILLIDTTNSGNAINKAVAACQKAIKAS